MDPGSQPPLLSRLPSGNGGRPVAKSQTGQRASTSAYNVHAFFFGVAPPRTGSDASNDDAPKAKKKRAAPFLDAEAEVWAPEHLVHVRIGPDHCVRMGACVRVCVCVCRGGRGSLGCRGGRGGRRWRRRRAGPSTQATAGRGRAAQAAGGRCRTRTCGGRDGRRQGRQRRGRGRRGGRRGR
jgi:hypothetical protein